MRRKKNKKKTRNAIAKLFVLNANAIKQEVGDDLSVCVLNHLR